MSNFGNVTLGGALVRIDGADVGFTDGDIEIYTSPALLAE